MLQAANDTQFKTREERRRTVLPARMRNGGSWSDACILNLSSRGLMIFAKCDAQPGSYVELRRGGRLVIARVVWRKNHRIGLFSQDRLPVDQIISSETAAGLVPANNAGIEVERRRQPRDHEHSRARSRAIEFLSLVLVAVVLASLAGAYVLRTLARPVAAAETVLGSR